MAAGARDDLADAGLVLDVARALRRWRDATGAPPATKILREAVWFFWQRPRLAGRLVRSKYPRGTRWSPAAAALVEAETDLRGRLVIEHLEPMNRVLRWLIDEAREVEEVADALRSRLEVVVVTTEEGKRLPDAGSPEQRYARAGLDLSSFVPLPD